jgi:hypothetical protein
VGAKDATVMALLVLSVFGGSYLLLGSNINPIEAGLLGSLLLAIPSIIYAVFYLRRTAKARSLISAIIFLGLAAGTKYLYPLNTLFLTISYGSIILFVWTFISWISYLLIGVPPHVAVHVSRGFKISYAIAVVLAIILVIVGLVLGGALFLVSKTNKPILAGDKVVMPDNPFRPVSASNVIESIYVDLKNYIALILFKGGYKIWGKVFSYSHNEFVITSDYGRLVVSGSLTKKVIKVNNLNVPANVAVSTSSKITRTLAPFISSLIYTMPQLININVLEILLGSYLIVMGEAIVRKRR